MLLGGLGQGSDSPCRVCILLNLIMCRRFLVPVQDMIVPYSVLMYCDSSENGYDQMTGLVSIGLGFSFRLPPNNGWCDGVVSESAQIQLFCFYPGTH